ncbi:DUF6349 family protein [Streptosporangium lutulentum]|uniref:Uncharacterized protein n=1 Tax=Streptosporangium lutulentum TaxID=1461250 RepID=A0ABT9Q9B3_9ACTN|nr:DUF6349 family protein [Streptosporangium lutulentum]MDP9843340.1 hypothetical protein [Streptosporangium lutulentum]
MSGEPRGAVAWHTLWQTVRHGEESGLWCIYITHPGNELGGKHPTSTAPEHRPTVLHWWGKSREKATKRGACLGCEWEGQDRRTEKDAVEDAHDHAWPGWRNLPGVLPPSSTALYEKKVYERWLAEVKRAYPIGWLEAGGPIVTIRRDSAFSRHEPGKAPGGGYDLAATYFRAKKIRDNHAQPTLDMEFPS